VEVGSTCQLLHFPPYSPSSPSSFLFPLRRRNSFLGERPGCHLEGVGGEWAVSKTCAMGDWTNV
jgi:hypothetical protein